MAILIADKLHSKTKIVTSDKEEHFYNGEMAIHQEGKQLKHITSEPEVYEAKLTELKREMDHSTIIIGDSNTPFSIRDKTARQKTNKEIEGLNNTVHELDLADIYGTFYPTTEYTFFSSAHGIFSRIDHISINVKGLK